MVVENQSMIVSSENSMFFVESRGPSFKSQFVNLFFIKLPLYGCFEHMSDKNFRIWIQDCFNFFGIISYKNCILIILKKNNTNLVQFKPNLMMI